MRARELPERPAEKHESEATNGVPVIGEDQRQDPCHTLQQAARHGAAPHAPSSPSELVEPGGHDRHQDLDDNGHPGSDHEGPQQGPCEDFLAALQGQPALQAEKGGVADDEVRAVAAHVDLVDVGRLLPLRHEDEGHDAKSPDALHASDDDRQKLHREPAVVLSLVVADGCQPLRKELGERKEQLKEDGQKNVHCHLRQPAPEVVLVRGVPAAAVHAVAPDVDQVHDELGDA
mmetsp:Transcript_88120/g.285185  ORF Transcript_88120/g.285185 Transcript_88120/m.285185 type:complete len:232 (-) Transcript_88120:690-1385(-)